MSVGKDKKILVPIDHDNLRGDLENQGYTNLVECDPNDIQGGIDSNNPDYVVRNNQPLGDYPNYSDDPTADFGCKVDFKRKRNS